MLSTEFLRQVGYVLIWAIMVIMANRNDESCILLLEEYLSAFGLNLFGGVLLLLGRTFSFDKSRQKSEFTEFIRESKEIGDVSSITNTLLSEMPH